MGLLGTCQTCMTTAPLEWFLSEAKYKQALVIVAAMPPVVATPALRYLSLFRPASGRSIAPQKVSRLLEEVAALVKSGYVQTKDSPARPCSPEIWAKAIEEMLVSTTITTPLPNHNYLKRVAWPLADQVDAATEKDGHVTGPTSRPRGRNPLAALMGFDDEGRFVGPEKQGE